MLNESTSKTFFLLNRGGREGRAVMPPKRLRWLIQQKTQTTAELCGSTIRWSKKCQCQDKNIHLSRHLYASQGNKLNWNQNIFVLKYIPCRRGHLHPWLTLEIFWGCFQPLFQAIVEGHKTPSVQSCFSLRMNLSEQDLSGRPLLPTKKFHTESL